MTDQLDRVETKRAELSRDPAGSMIADENGAAASVGIDQLDGGRLVGSRQRCS
jgi:hypothetical protein